MWLAILIDIVIALIIIVFISAISHFFVRKIKDNKRLTYICLGFSIFFIICFIFHLLFPWVDYGILKVFFWWKMEYLLIAVSAIILVTIRFSNCQQFYHKILIIFLGSILLILATLPFTLRPVMHLLWKDRKTVIKDGVVMQQSGYSCGAGSLATVLQMKGYHVTEGDAVIALRIVPILGTEPDCVPPAVKKLTGNKFDARAKYCPIEMLDKINMPCISTLKHRGLIGHYVVILNVDKKTVKIGDPLVGVKTVTKDELAKRWKDVVIEIHDN